MKISNAIGYILASIGILIALYVLVSLTFGDPDSQLQPQHIHVVAVVHAGNRIVIDRPDSVLPMVCPAGRKCI